MPEDFLRRVRDFPLRYVVACLAFIAVLAGCGSTEVVDAPLPATTTTTTLELETDVFELDGVEVHTTCDHGNRLYLTWSMQARLTVVPADPSCVQLGDAVVIYQDGDS